MPTRTMFDFEGCLMRPAAPVLNRPDHRAGTGQLLAATASVLLDARLLEPELAIAEPPNPKRDHRGARSGGRGELPLAQELMNGQGAEGDAVGVPATPVSG